MSDNKPNVDNQEEEFDLSSMINEYEEDGDLRRKIESMKKEKAQDDARRLAKQEQEAAPERSAFGTNPTDQMTASFSSAETSTDELGKTRVISMDGDGDKTLVIMDHERGKTFEAKKANQEEDESIFVYDNRQVDEEEITEEDIKEFLGEDDDKKKRTPMDPDKKNKIITYIICGCVGLLLLIGIGFGVKMVIDNMGNDGEKTEEKETEKDKDKDNNTEKDPDKDNGGNSQTDGGNDDGGNTTTDNSVRIAEIKGEIKGYEANLETLKSSLTTHQTKLDTANKKATEIGDKISPLKTKLDNELSQDLTIKNAKVAEIQKAIDSGDKTYTTADLEVAKTAATQADTLWKQTNGEIQTLNSEKAVYDKEVNDANTEITNVNAQITEIQQKISTLQDELNSLQ